MRAGNSSRLSCWSWALRRDYGPELHYGVLSLSLSLTHTHTFTHTHSHTHPLSLSLSLSYTLSLAHTLSVGAGRSAETLGQSCTTEVTLSHSLPLTHTHTHSLTHSRSCPHTHTLSLFLPPFSLYVGAGRSAETLGQSCTTEVSLSHSHTLTHTYSISLSHTHSLSFTLSLLELGAPLTFWARAELRRFGAQGFWFGVECARFRGWVSGLRFRVKFLGSRFWSFGFSIESLVALRGQCLALFQPGGRSLHMGAVRPLEATARASAKI